MTLVDTMRQARSRFLVDTLCVVGASLFLALLSQIELPLWFSPIPITLQTFGVMLIAATLGSKRGVCALVAYLGEGAMGFPVFAGGKGGLAVLFGPTAGYLCGFVIAVFIMGLMFKKNTHFLKTLGATCLGSLVILMCGTAWLGLVVSFETALTIGFYPFLLGSLIKSVAATSIIQAKRAP